MTENSTHLTTDEDESMQTETFHLSGDEDTEIHYSMSDPKLTNVTDEQRLNHFVIYLNDPTVTVQTTIST